MSELLRVMGRSFKSLTSESERCLSSPTVVASMLTIEPWPIHQKWIGTSWRLLKTNQARKLIRAGKIHHGVTCTWHWHMGQVKELWLSCYPVLLSTDSKTKTAAPPWHDPYIYNCWAHHVGALLSKSNQPISSWWLQMSWHHVNTRASATTILI